MQPLAASPAYALRLRAGRQNALLSPWLVRLHARLAPIPGAAIVAAARSFDQPASEARLLLHLPGYPCQQARNMLVAWAETTIDALHDAQPYGGASLLDSGAWRDSGAHRILVRCEAADAALWLDQHAGPRSAAALVAMSEHLPRLLPAEPSLLKSALPVAIAAALSGQFPRRGAALSALVFMHSPASGLVREMLAQCDRLERAGLLLRRASLPATAQAVFARLVGALQHGLAVAGGRGGRIKVARLLLNQLGFGGPEADYLILLALPPAALRALLRHWRVDHAL